VFLRHLAHSRAANAAVLTIALALLVAGCGGKQESAADAKASFCKSLDNLAAQVVALQGLDFANTSKDDLEDATGKVQDAWKQVKDDAQDLEDANVRELEQAGDKLSSSVDGLDSDTTLTQAVTALGAQLSAFAQAFTKAVASAGCKQG
jgi:hypothetical protein